MRSSASQGTSASHPSTAQRVGRNRKEYDCNRGEVVRSRTARYLLLLARFRGPEQPSLHLPHPSRSTRTEVQRISADLYSACAIRSKSHIQVQPLEKSAISAVIVIDALDECKDEEPASAIPDPGCGNIRHWSPGVEKGSVCCCWRK